MLPGRRVQGSAARASPLAAPMWALLLARVQAPAPGLRRCLSSVPGREHCPIPEALAPEP